jgi:hypothetical protein
VRPVTDAFLRRVRSSHQMCTRVRVVTGFPVGTDPDGVEITVTDGTVTMDATADIRSIVDLSVAGTAWPSSAAGLLAPYGNELYIERGVESGNSREWVSLGYFRINTVNQDDAPSGPIRIDGRDRMANIKDARLLSPVHFGKGTSVEDVVAFLVNEIYPDAVPVFDFDAGATTLGSAQIATEDRYGFLLDLAKSLGKVFHFDYTGQPVMVSVPDPSDPVFDITHGRGGVLVQASRSLDRDGVYNAVVASGEHPESDVPPVRAVARDMNPDSPTYWNGTFGHVPRFYTSSFITTLNQAGKAAESLLASSIGLPHNVAFQAVPNPALEPDDPVRVSYSDNERVEVHVLQTVTMPLGASSAMAATTREQTGIDIEVSDS